MIYLLRIHAELPRAIIVSKLHNLKYIFLYIESHIIFFSQHNHWYIHASQLFLCTLILRNSTFKNVWTCNLQLYCFFPILKWISCLTITGRNMKMVKSLWPLTWPLPWPWCDSQWPWPDSVWFPYLYAYSFIPNANPCVFKQYCYLKNILLYHSIKFVLSLHFVDSDNYKVEQIAKLKKTGICCLHAFIKKGIYRLMKKVMSYANYI
jgi:hypothetical protein